MKTSVLVVSCDKYRDLWVPFFYQFFKYWQSDIFDIYLGSNKITFDDPRVFPITVGKDISWSANLTAMLKQIQTKYIITILDDFFLRSPVIFDKLNECINGMESLNAAMIRLVPRPRPDKKIPGYGNIGLIDTNSAYRVSTQGAIWDKKRLMKLLSENENIWEFEINGSERSRKELSGYYCVWESVLTYRHHVVERGKWFRREARQFSMLDIGCDFSVRPIMTEKENYYWHVKKILSYPQTMIPWTYRQKIKKFLRSCNR
jgi:hypothetical protein